MKVSERGLVLLQARIRPAVRPVRAVSALARRKERMAVDGPVRGMTRMTEGAGRTEDGIGKTRHGHLRRSRGNVLSSRTLSVCSPTSHIPSDSDTTLFVNGGVSRGPYRDVIKFLLWKLFNF